MVRYAAIVMALLSTPADLARAQEMPQRTQQARARFDEGMELAEQGRYYDAEKAFAASFALVRRPNTQFNWAVALFHQGRFAESLRLLDSFLSRTDPVRDTEQRRRAEVLRERAAAKIASITLVLSPESATIEGIDALGTGRVRKAYLPPGSHHVAVSAPGYRARAIEIDAHAAQRQTVQVTLERQPPPKPEVIVRVERRSSRVVPWSMTIGGGVLLASAAVTGLLALSADHEVTDQCKPDGPLCERPELRSAQSRAKALAVVTDVLGATGVLSLGLGTGWLALFGAGAQERKPKAALSVALNRKDGVFSEVHFAF